MQSLLPLDPIVFARHRYRATVECAIFAEIAQRLVERVTILKIQPQHVLTMGLQANAMRAQLQQYFVNSTCVALDLAVQLLPRKRWWQKSRLAIVGDYLQLPIADAEIDLAVANLNLLGAVDIKQSLQSLLRIMRGQGAILFATFGPDTLKELRQSFAFDHFPHVHPFVDMHDIGDTLLATGFSNPVVDMEILTVEYSDILQLCRDLKLAGLQNAHKVRRRSLMSKACWKEMLTHYEELIIANKYPATFEIIYGHAWAPEIKTSRLQGNEVAIPVDFIGLRKPRL